MNYIIHYLCVFAILSAMFTAALMIPDLIMLIIIKGKEEIWNLVLTFGDKLLSSLLALGIGYLINRNVFVEMGIEQIRMFSIITIIVSLHRFGVNYGQLRRGEIESIKERFFIPANIAVFDDEFDDESDNGFPDSLDQKKEVDVFYGLPDEIAQSDITWIVPEAEKHGRDRYDSIRAFIKKIGLEIASIIFVLIMGFSLEFVGPEHSYMVSIFGITGASFGGTASIACFVTAMRLC